MAGGTFTYEFIATPFGSHMYHSHHNAAEQVALGLLGALVVEPQDKAKEPAADKEYTIILNDGPHGFTLNGKSFPATEPLTAKLGQKVRTRFMHEGQMIHRCTCTGCQRRCSPETATRCPSRTSATR